jgi:hypothetical protein
MMYKYYIESGGVSYEHTPLNAGQLTKTWSLAENEAYKGYDEKISEGVVFGKAVYDFMKILESTSFCDVLYFRIESSCDGTTYNEYIRTQFFITNVEFRESTCKVVIKTSKAELCTNRKTVYNVFQGIPSRKDVKINNGVISVEYVMYSGAATNPTNSQPIWGNTASPNPANTFYQVQKNVIVWNGNSGTTTTTWVREKLTIGCTDTVDASWFLIADNCPINKIYGRFANMGECTTETVGNTTTYECKVLFDTLSSLNITQIPNAVSLKDVLEYLCSQSCGFTSVKSDFFQINPDNISNINYVTGLKTKTDNIYIFDNSDVKRPNALQKAVRLDLSFDSIMLALKQIFNIRWRITNNVLVVEHLMFFTKIVSIDTTLTRYLPYVAEKTNYRYATENIPKYESLAYKAARQSSTFRKATIDYSDCANTKDETKAVVVDCMTDLILCLNNSDIDSNVVSDEGFFVAACGFNSANELYFLTQFQSNLATPTPNNTLSPIFLLKDYHRYGRPFTSGFIEGDFTTFFNSRIKEGDEIEIPICCSDAPVNPDSLIKTLVGDGEIEEIKQSLLTGKTSFKLKY